MAQAEKSKPGRLERRRDKKNEKNKSRAIRVADQQRDREAAARRRKHWSPPSSSGGMA